MKGKCLVFDKEVISKTPACEEAKEWSKLEVPPLFVPCLAARYVNDETFRTDGAPPMCRDCCCFQPEGQPLGLAEFPIEDD